ncbi:MAG TPA: D-alanyl-D-alanine carboxypeptidase [Candidatus Paceibacterota bacterium]
MTTKTLLTTFLSASFVLGITAGPLYGATLTTELNTLVDQQKIARAKQSVCIEQNGVDTLSYNAQTRIIPASVSKLYTFDFALATLPEDFRYTTNFYVQGTTLYINGAGDPHFVAEHLTKVLTTVQSEKNIVIDHIVFTPGFYFNWEMAPAAVQTALANAVRNTPGMPVSPNVRITLSLVPYNGKGTSYQFSSAPLPALLKQINNYSTNISADILLSRLGGPVAFSEYMKKTYDAGPETVSFMTGSGLYGNYTTCALTLRVIKHLESQLKERDLEVTDVLSMPKVDPGVIEKRAINMDGKNAIVAKSGFVNYHHALAGVINTADKPAYFAIFTNYNFMAQTSAVKTMVDQYTEKILAHFSPTLESFDYAPDPSIFEDVLIKKL